MHRHEQLPEAEEELGRISNVHVLQQREMPEEGGANPEVAAAFAPRPFLQLAEHRCPRIRTLGLCQGLAPASFRPDPKPIKQSG